MGTATTLLALGTLVAGSAGLFYFKDDIKNAFRSESQKDAAAKKTDAETKVFTETAKNVNDGIKGINNAGEKLTGFFEEFGSSLLGKSTITGLETQKEKLGFSKDAIVEIYPNGIIKSNQSPQLNLSDSERQSALEAFRKNKEKSNYAKNSGKRKRFGE